MIFSRNFSLFGKFMKEIKSFEMINTKLNVCYWKVAKFLLDFNLFKYHLWSITFCLLLSKETKRVVFLIPISTHILHHDFTCIIPLICSVHNETKMKLFRSIYHWIQHVIQDLIYRSGSIGVVVDNEEECWMTVRAITRILWNLLNMIPTI
jgi:hypothetical protein